MQMIIGNWKMNGLQASLDEARAFAAATSGDTHVIRTICPPATLLLPMAEALQGSGVSTGGQDCHETASGAHTGDISAVMLADSGASFVIVGHSERRTDHGESSELVSRKALAAAGAGLHPVICVGETRVQREAGAATSIVLEQLSVSIPENLQPGSFSIAYEPVWAIGTGLVASPDDIAAMHATIRDMLLARYGEAGRTVAILYGGSVKPDNAATILRIDNVGGALVGGASLKAIELVAIVQAARRPV